MYPEFGARHPITYTDEIDIFFTDVNLALGEVLPDQVVFDEEGNWLDKRQRQFRLYDDPRRVGVTVLERRATRMYGQRQRVKWNRNDEGRIKGQIENEVARLELNGAAQSAEFTQVVRLGNIDQPRKLGLILDQETTLSEFLVREHELVIDGISSSLRHFKGPYESFIPHWTFARISREAHPQALNQAVNAVQSILPISVELEPIQLYAHQDIPLNGFD